jgi:transmembrane sensor
MEGTPESARRAATIEAAEWSVLLQDDPDDADLRRRFEAWHRQSALNAGAWAEIQSTAGLAREALPAYAHEWQPIVAAKSGRSRQSTGRRRWLLPVASMALAAVIAWAAVPAVLLQLQADHVTGTAELRTIRLQDGSEVTLAPDSAVAVSYEPGERRVRLLQGEAFFAVASDRQRPFRVTARSVQASVLGTSFDVRLDEATVTVAVQEGRVLVEATDEVTGRGETLQAGQAVRVAGKGEFARLAEKPGMIAAWRRGELYLRNRPLGEAVSEIRRYFPGAIIVTDAALETLPTTGVFNTADPEGALRGIAQAQGARVRRLSPWLLVLSGS